MSIHLDKSPPLTLFWGHGNERATSAQGRGAEPAADPGRGEGALYRARPGGVAERHRPPRRRRRGHRLSAFPRPGAADRGALRAAARADPRAGRGSPRRARSLAGVHTLPRARPRAQGHARTARATPGSTGLSDPDGRALGGRLDAPARLRSREWLLDRLARIASRCSPRRARSVTRLRLRLRALRGSGRSAGRADESAT